MCSGLNCLKYQIHTLFKHCSKFELCSNIRWKPHFLQLSNTINDWIDLKLNFFMVKHCQILNKFLSGSGMVSVCVFTCGNSMSHRSSSPLLAFSSSSAHLAHIAIFINNRYQGHHCYKVDLPGNVTSWGLPGKCYFPENVTSRKMWVPGKCDLPENATSREMWLLWKCDLPGNVTSRKMWLPGYHLYIGSLNGTFAPSDLWC